MIFFSDHCFIFESCVIFFLQYLRNHLHKKFYRKQWWTSEFCSYKCYNYKKNETTQGFYFHFKNQCVNKPFSGVLISVHIRTMLKSAIMIIKDDNQYFQNGSNTVITNKNYHINENNLHHDYLIVWLKSVYPVFAQSPHQFSL